MVTNRRVRARKINNREEPRAELRRRVVDAALALFKESGFDSVSVDQIVARAEVSKGTFFNFFPRKNDVLFVYFGEIEARIALLQGKLDSRQPLPALEKFFARAERLLSAEGPLIETLSRAIWSDNALREADRASAVQDRRAFAEFFRQAQAARAIDPEVDPVVAADALGDLWTGSILLWLAFGRKYSLSKTVRPKIRLLFNGLRKKRK